MLDTIPGTPGAYILQIALDQTLHFEIARMRGTLSAGTYAYVGSACGPGGLRARIARHLRDEKPIHWHIDRLTTVGRVTAVAYGETACECDLAEALAGLSGATVPIVGFGSSDCRRCRAHLIRLPHGVHIASAVTGGAALRYPETPEALCATA